jgi:hypothetical protein
MFRVVIKRKKKKKQPLSLTGKYSESAQNFIFNFNLSIEECIRI